jgi:hypothetical protein
LGRKYPIEYHQHCYVEACWVKGALGGDKKLQGVLLAKPSSLMRPDGLMLSRTENRIPQAFWTLAISAKLWSVPFPTEQVQADLFSTDVTKFYYKKDGKSVSRTAQNKQAAWQTLLTQFNHVGSLRLHILLPYVANQVFFFC